MTLQLSFFLSVSFNKYKYLKVGHQDKKPSNLIRDQGRKLGMNFGPKTSQLIKKNREENLEFDVWHKLDKKSLNLRKSLKKKI